MIIPVLRGYGGRLGWFNRVKFSQDPAHPVIDPNVEALIHKVDQLLQTDPAFRLAWFQHWFLLLANATQPAHYEQVFKKKRWWTVKDSNLRPAD